MPVTPSTMPDLAPVCVNRPRVGVSTGCVSHLGERTLGLNALSCRIEDVCSVNRPVMDHGYIPGMANMRSRLRSRPDARGPGKWPCPCCGYRTLHEGPGDYDLCPVCFWEDASDQLRWPTLADGPNGISLIEAQRNFVEIGACHAESLTQVRRPK